MKVGIIGAGPAGSLCASLLRQAGGEVLLFDYRGVWEKPCGGGVTHKAIVQYPFLKECFEEKRRITQVRVISPRDVKVTVTLQDPLFIYSRDILNKILLERAISEGVHFCQERILDFKRQNSHWRLKTENSDYSIDFLIGADGVNSFVRRKLSNPFAVEDLMMTYGYRVFCRGEDTVEIKFLRNLLGYLWVFARPNNISFGICGRLGQNPTRILKAYLHEFLYQNYPDVRRNLVNRASRDAVLASHVSPSSYETLPSTAAAGVSLRGTPCQLATLRYSSGGFGETAVLLPDKNHAFSSPVAPPKGEMKNSYVSWETYSALIPSLRSRTLRSNKIQGQGWALLGDAAGFADPITCEGIYYALRSGELLARALTQSRLDSYSRKCKEDFVDDFIQAAELFEKFYTGRFLGSDFITRVVQTTSRSKVLQTLMNSFIAGKQDYKSLRSTLIRMLPRICLQVMRSAFLE